MRGEGASVKEMDNSAELKSTVGCIECGGIGSRHYTDCTVWIGDQVSPKRLRDEFAMAALTGMLASPMLTVHASVTLSADSYKMADAMLAARNK